MNCATHHEVETRLTCASCSKPICPRCMIQTPVGIKCKDCARMHRPRMFVVTPQHYLRAASAGLGLALALGFAWAIVRLYVPFSGFFGFVIAIGIGYSIGELMYRAAGRKRGTWLAVAAGACVVISSGLGLLVFPQLLSNMRSGFGILDLLFVVAGVLVAVNTIR